MGLGWGYLSGLLFRGGRIYDFPIGERVGDLSRGRGTHFNLFSSRPSHMQQLYWIATERHGTPLPFGDRMSIIIYVYFILGRRERRLRGFKMGGF